MKTGDFSLVSLEKMKRLSGSREIALGVRLRVYP